jgi:hypothetical protein
MKQIPKRGSHNLPGSTDGAIVSVALNNGGEVGDAAILNGEQIEEGAVDAAMATSGHDMETPFAMNGGGFRERIAGEGETGGIRRKRNNGMEVDEEDINAHNERALLYIIPQRR